MATDWRAWHAKYDEPESSLARRLAVVRQRVAETLVEQQAGAQMRILSLCSGDGRDLIPALARGGHQTTHTVLVERDPTLAQDARATAAGLELSQVHVITGDAGETSVFAFALPVDLLMLCGIFGNVSNQDIAATIAATPRMLRPGATVIWTRGSTAPDLRSVIHAWFLNAGFREMAFDSEPDGFGVGVARIIELATPRPLPHRLFTFSR